MVRGTSRRVIVVESPDPNLFEQAIFIVKNDVFTEGGITPQQVLGEACRIAKGYTATPTKPARRWKKIPWWAWIPAAAVVLMLIVMIF